MSALVLSTSIGVIEVFVILLVLLITAILVISLVWLFSTLKRKGKL